MSTPLLVRRNTTLDDRYQAESGPVMLTGIQALVRLTLDQRRLDDRRGHDTGIFVSGYQGSPLGGLDQELARSRKHLDPAGVVFRPGLNEELAATAVAGSQLLGQLERRRRAGVTGFWFGKNPGLDRAADAIRHGNLSGTAPLGGAVAWIGDDPSSKSSTVPSVCEPICRSLMMPVLAPGTVAEILELGLHAVALSRYSGLWTGLKIVADNADATAGVELTGMLDRIPDLGLRAERAAPVLLPPSNLEAEHELMTLRLERAREYARLADLNAIVRDSRRPRIAIVAAGLGQQAVLRALADLGLDERATEELGVRVVRLAMPWPVERDELRRLLAGVETVLVVEDKLPFLETLIRDALYAGPARPVVVGKEDGDGRPLLSARSMLSADDVAAALARVLPGDALPAVAQARIAAQQARGSAATGERPLPARTPYFCSGCPHNRSTRARPDQLVGGGIGCHTMVALDDSGERGTLLGMPQMGGEGAQWLGLAPFTADEHIFQNLGDGTFHHSGSLAIRAAVAGDARITYRLLYNDAVAMTGGQQPQGRMAVPELTRWLALEGVAKVVITTPEPSSYRRVRLDPIASVRHRDDLPQVQDELAAVAGVTVLIHDDRCATEERRLRKRGKLEAPAERVFINERVCEGCGDCGKKSTCLSVLPVDTEFGRKTQIHQASCNQDFSCLDGDCPSFLLVTPGRERGPFGRAWRRLLSRGANDAVDDATGATPGVAQDPPVPLTEPERRVPDDVLVRMPGVGGTGVVTVSQILQMAAHLDGRSAAGLEQIGLAQKGGPVTSDLRIASTAIEGQLRASAGRADVLLGFDLLGAASPGTLEVADPERTVAVVSTARTPTAEMVTDPTVRFPSVRRPIGRIDRATRRHENLYLDAQRLAEELFGDHLPANMLLVGAAFQHGCLPLSADAIERAIGLNGAAVAANVAAFRWGRAAAIDLGAVEAAARRTTPALPEPVVDPRAVTSVAPLGLPPTLRRGVERRASELIAFQNLDYAERYVADVGRVAAVERERAPAAGHRAPDEARNGDERLESLPVTRAYAQYLHKLMAYKDEYEIARLHRDPVQRARVVAELGPGAKVQVLLHPPLLRALGLRRKLKLGGWILPAFAVLYRMRGLRGTAWDPFGRAEVRRVERALIDEYRALVDDGLSRLGPETTAQVVALCELPDVIRGYEQIKLDNVATFRAQAAQQLQALRAGTGATRR